jgi:hypothetical protein
VQVYRKQLQIKYLSFEVDQSQGQSRVKEKQEELSLGKRCVAFL